MAQDVKTLRNPDKSKWKKRDLLKHVRNEYDLYLMLVPMLLFYLFFAYKPMTSLIIAFKDYSPFLGPWESEWVEIGRAHV